MFSVEALIVAFLAVMLLASFISLRAKVPYTLVLVILGIVLSAASGLSILGQANIQQAVLQMSLLLCRLDRWSNRRALCGTRGSTSSFRSNDSDKIRMT